MAGRDIVVSDNGSIVFKETATNTDGVTLKGPGSTADFTIVLPAAVGSGSGQVLNAATAGSTTTLSFGAPTDVGMAGLNALAQAGIDGDDGDGDDSTEAIADLIGNSETAGAWGGGSGSIGSRNDRVLFPSGNYQIKQLGNTSVDGGDRACFDAANSYCLEGVGMGMTTFIGVDSSDEIMLQHDADGAHSEAFVLRNMTFDGNDQTTNSAKIVLKADYIIIDSVEFSNMAGGIKIKGDPKLISITNCRWTNLKDVAGNTCVEFEELGNDDCHFIFTNNRIEGTAPASDGNGQVGIVVDAGATGDSLRCTIKDNFFSNLGNAGAKGAIDLDTNHDSIIEGNFITDYVGTPISIKNSNRVRVANNRITDLSSDADVGDTIVGIHVSGDGSIEKDVEITGNVVTGGAGTGIVVEDMEDVIVSDNSIDGPKVSIHVDDVEGKVHLKGNSCRNMTLTAPSFAAMHIQDLSGDAQVVVEGNRFIGGGDSGRAIYMDRNNPGGLTTNTAGKVHFLLKDNIIDNMGQDDGVWDGGTIADNALIFINGHASDDVLRTFHASGNRYDFTSSDDNSYGMFVDNVKKTCTFDSVLEFGAQGDGSQDDTMAINRAGKAAGVNGSVYVPQGTYDLIESSVAETIHTNTTPSASGACIVPAAAGQVWHGEGTLHINASGSALNLLDCTDKPTTIKGLSFTNGGTSTGYAIIASTGANDRVADCNIDGFGKGVKLEGTHSTVKNCYILDTRTGSAIEAIDGCTDSIITSNHITSDATSGADNGITGKFVRGSISGNIIRNAGAKAISLSQNSVNTNVTGNEITNCGTVGIAIVGATSNDCKNITVSGNNITKSEGAAAGKEDITITFTNDSTVAHNSSTSFQTKLLISGTCTSLSVIGNHFDMVDADPGSNLDCIKSDGTLTHCVVNSNTLRSSVFKSRQAGLNLNVAEKCVVNGNAFDNFDTGIKIVASGDNNQLTNNVFTNVDNEVSDAGSGNQTFFSTSNHELGGDIVRIGSGGYSSATVPSNLPVYIAAGGGGQPEEEITVSNSFHFVAASVAASTQLKRIKLDVGGDSKHTRKASNGGDDAEALATAVYDGMILLLVSTSTNNITFQGGVDGAASTTEGFGTDWAPGSEGKNIYVGDDAAGFLDDIGDSALLRFEHDGTEGIWRVIVDRTFS